MIIQYFIFMIFLPMKQCLILIDLTIYKPIRFIFISTTILISIRNLGACLDFQSAYAHLFAKSTQKIAEKIRVAS